jgi:hypothetical protein
MTDFETDVLVVGTGPAGAAAALALATYGVRVHIVTLWNWLANTPRAHITNQRAVEVLRDLGIEEEAKKYATPWEQMSEMLFCTSLAGEEIARIKAWGTGDDRAGDYIAGSPCPLLDIPQLYMEPLLGDEPFDLVVDGGELPHLAVGAPLTPIRQRAPMATASSTGASTASSTTWPARRSWPDSAGGCGTCPIC